MEPNRATITMNRPGDPRVERLDQAGRLTGQKIPASDGTFQIDGARDKTPYYLIRY